MQTLKSCWNYLRYATGDHVIVSLGADTYDILSVGPGSLGEYFIESTPACVVGIFPPGTDWDAIAEAADVLKTANHESNDSKRKSLWARGLRFFKLTASGGR